MVVLHDGGELPLALRDDALLCVLHDGDADIEALRHDGEHALLLDDDAQYAALRELHSASVGAQADDERGHDLHHVPGGAVNSNNLRSTFSLAPL